MKPGNTKASRSTRVSDPTTEELAREWVASATAGQPSDWLVSTLTALLNRVAKEQDSWWGEAWALKTQIAISQARAEERKRCVTIVQAALATAAGQTTSGCADARLALADVLRRIEEGK